MTDKKMHLNFDNVLINQDNYLPLERIQDIDINQDCVARVGGVKSIVISTAGGTPIQIYGLKVRFVNLVKILTLLQYLVISRILMASVMKSCAEEML